MRARTSRRSLYWLSGVAISSSLGAANISRPSSSERIRPSLRRGGHAGVAWGLFHLGMERQSVQALRGPCLGGATYTQQEPRQRSRGGALRVWTSHVMQIGGTGPGVRLTGCSCANGMLSAKLNLHGTSPGQLWLPYLRTPRNRVWEKKN